ncbi:MAG: rod shape-determining protein, partial [Candidatus Caldatribacteriota bacterium]|nr:rod shape-determining protein [Candidatus Caldatribacteriota bacterium]
MLSDFLFGSFSKSIGIDLGTSTTLVYVKGKSVVLYEPSVVAFGDNGNKILAVGEEAKKMIGRTPAGLFTVRPLKEGVIADFEVTAEMLKYFIKRVHIPNRFVKASIVICVPSGVTEVEKRAVSEVAYKCGARKVSLVDESIAAAIGAGLPIFEPMGNMVLDIGGGTSEVAVISLGGIVVSELSKVAGDYINDEIVKYIKRKYNIHIGELTAEKIKLNLTKDEVDKEIESYEIKGRDKVSGLPKIINISIDELREALSGSIKIIANIVKMTLEKTPPELVSDIVDKGIIMTGGGSVLIGLAELLQEEIGIPIFISPKPVYCVINGIGKIVE